MIKSHLVVIISAEFIHDHKSIENKEALVFNGKEFGFIAIEDNIWQFHGYQKLATPLLIFIGQKSSSLPYGSETLWNPS